MYVLRGYVRDHRGSAKAGAEVALFKGEETGPTATTETNASGQWHFEVSDPAPYRIRVQYDDVTQWLEPDNCVQFGLLTGLDGVTAPLAPDSITHDHLRDGTITTAKIADGAITSEKILPGSLSPGNLGEGALGSDIFPEESLEERHLAPGSIESSSFAKHAILPVHVRDRNTPVHASDEVRLSAPTPRSLEGNREMGPTKLKEFLIGVSGVVRVRYFTSGVHGYGYWPGEGDDVLLLRAGSEIHLNGSKVHETNVFGNVVEDILVKAGDRLSIHCKLTVVKGSGSDTNAQITVENARVGWGYDTLDDYQDNAVLED